MKIYILSILCVSMLIGAETVTINDFDISIPEGWGFANSSKNTKGIVYFPKANPGDPNAMIAFDVGKPMGETGTTDKLASAFAGKWNGKVGGDIMLDGVNGKRITAGTKAGGLAPKHAISLVYNETAYLIILASKDEISDQVLTEIAKSWKWK